MPSVSMMLLAAGNHEDDGSYWKIIVVLAGVVGTLAFTLWKRELSRGKAIAKVKDDCAAEVKELMQQQIKELKDHRELADTLIKVIDRKRTGG